MRTTTTPKSVRYFKLGEGVDLHDMRQELKDMADVLLGRVDPPIQMGVSTLMEVAEAFHARAREMEMLLHEAEADGVILKTGKHSAFRKGQLRVFLEMARKAIDLGSRRVTVAQMESELREFS